MLDTNPTQVAGEGSSDVENRQCCGGVGGKVRGGQRWPEVIRRGRRPVCEGGNQSRQRVGVVTHLPA